MPLKVRFLRKCHTEVRRGRRIIKTKQWKSRRHRRCIERRSLFANSISNLYTKRLSQNSYQDSVGYTSVALCAVSTSVTLHYLRSLRDSVCLLYMTFSLSLHLSEEPKKISNVSKIVLFTYDNSFIQVYCKALTLLPKLLQILEFHPIVFTSNPSNTLLIDDSII